MTLTHQQLAELLAGIARSQQAIVDAIDRAQPGFRGTYLLPTLNVAANLRIPQTRLLDLPSRILLRSQGRVPMDAETIQRALQEALDGSVAFDPPPAPPPAYRLQQRLFLRFLLRLRMNFFSRDVGEPLPVSA